MADDELEHPALRTAARKGKLTLVRSAFTDDARLNVVAFPDGQYHVYLSSGRTEWARRKFRLAVRDLTLTGAWSEAERNRVNAEFLVSAENGVPLTEAEQEEFSVATESG